MEDSKTQDKLLLIYLFVCVSDCLSVLLSVLCQETALRSQFSLSSVWILGLGSRIFTCRAILPTQVVLYSQVGEA